jgi:hypothetical protein
MIDECGTDRKTRKRAFRSGELTLASNCTEEAVGEISLWTVQSDLWLRRSTRVEKRALFLAFWTDAAFRGIAFFDSKQQN